VEEAFVEKVEVDSAVHLAFEGLDPMPFA
jgi:hypothetical protein